MTVRTRAELNSDADSTLANNASGAITPAILRQRVKDLADSARLAEDKPRIGTTASSATPAPNADSHDQYNVTALAEAAAFAAPTGTPADGQKLIIRIKDNGTARALSFNAVYRELGVTLPTTTVISKTMMLGFIYNAADAKWDLIAKTVQA